MSRLKLLRTPKSNLYKYRHKHPSSECFHRPSRLWCTYSSSVTCLASSTHPHTIYTTGMLHPHRHYAGYARHPHEPVHSTQPDENAERGFKTRRAQSAQFAQAFPPAALRACSLDETSDERQRRNATLFHRQPKFELFSPAYGRMPSAPLGWLWSGNPGVTSVLLTISEHARFFFFCFSPLLHRRCLDPVWRCFFHLARFLFFFLRSLAHAVSRRHLRM